VHATDRTRQVLVRPGISYEYKKGSSIYVDYQFGSFWNDTGTLNVHRALAGIEHGINDWIFLRAGTTYDVRNGRAAWTGGVGFYPTSWFSLDMAYQYDMFPEIAQDFGRAQTLNISMSFTF
jgi:hypothetical protein